MYFSRLVLSRQLVDQYWLNSYKCTRWDCLLAFWHLVTDLNTYLHKQNSTYIIVDLSEWWIQLFKTKYFTLQNTYAKKSLEYHLVLLLDTFTIVTPRRRQGISSLIFMAFFPYKLILRSHAISSCTEILLKN